ncbi:MAG: KEOPS complex subunit Pcc1 [Candidatus Methanomethylophilaceae archaeon]|jgi:tRNA threonylcarbamoyladenosine modification (KEOPS) complex  Pcc1 subunit|nr:KEOPS complex subunit Pcc1 [Candidatus Methanomethylophilaceae archaeon]
MRADLRLTVEYDDERTAAMIEESLEPDNEGYLSSQRKGRELTFILSAASAGTLRNTADDLLACLKAAEETLSLGPSHAVADLDGDAFLE